MNQNPLLDFRDLPRFAEIRPEHVTPAIDILLAECEAEVLRLTGDIPLVDWDNFITPLEDCTEKLSRAWGIISHLNAVMDTPELRETYNDNLPRITAFWAGLAQNLALFEKYRGIRHRSDFDTLSRARRQVVEHALRDFRLGGAELPEDQKNRFMTIQEEMAAISTRFAENVLDATNDYALYVEEADKLTGLPDDVLYAAKQAAEADGKTGWKFTLHFPSYYPVLQFAENRFLRETLYRAYVTRASELGARPEWDNSAHMLGLLKLRRKEAHMLGYPNYAELSLVPKMATSPQEVIHFLEDLAQRARPFAEKDFRELQDFARDTLNLTHLEAWDIAYASEKLREARYAFSDQEVKQYFPESRVISGLFHLIEQLFSVRVLPDTAEVWHPDVRFYRIEKEGQLLGQFYLDLYARPGKRGGAWMDDARNRRKTPQGIQTPVTYLTCNFTPPVTKNGVLQPSLFRHEEVTTLFHEFGHGLHQMLTQVDELGVSGISGVEWDAVELPSQFMENFCWEWDILQNMTAHIETGEPLSRVLYDRMLAARHFQSGLQILRQIEFSLTDMHLHTDFDPEGSQSIQDILDQVRKQYAVLIPPAFNRFLHGFNHIFAGGYAAGYYSYKWAELLSADVYSAFEEAQTHDAESIISPTIGSKLWQEILSVGGSRPAMESFEAFRGRKPEMEALLRHNGLTGQP